jgi:hypothetical protein
MVNCFLPNFAKKYTKLQENIPDTLIYSPGRSVSEFLDPGLWEIWRHSPGLSQPLPFLNTAPADMLLQPMMPAEVKNNWIFWVLLAGFSILTMTRYYHSKRLKLLGSALFKRSSAIQLIRESPVYSHRSFFPLLSIYVISLTLLIQQATEITSGGSGEGISALLVFAQFLGIYIAFSLFKIFVIWLTGVTFKNTDTAKEYIQNILIYNLSLGILLLPVLLLIIYTYHEFFLYFAGGLVLIMIGLRFIRGIAIGLSDSKFSLFHLFLYLCTLEILPIAFAAKFLSKYFLT